MITVAVQNELLLEVSTMPLNESWNCEAVSSS